MQRKTGGSCWLEELESQDDFILLFRKKWHCAPPGALRRWLTQKLNLLLSD